MKVLVEIAYRYGLECDWSECRILKCYVGDTGKIRVEVPEDVVGVYSFKILQVIPEG